MAENGFEINAQGLNIRKDPNAKLSYGFDWSQWLTTGDNLATVVYTVQARLNDPSPVTIVQDGIDANISYVTLQGGQINKSYKVTATVTTAAGFIDSRYFIVKVESKSA